MLTHYPKGPIETPRLILRAFHEKDLECVHRQFSDLDMCLYYADPPCTEEEAQEIIVHYSNMEEAKEMRWVIEDKITGAFIGTCGFHYFDALNGKVEIGYDIWKTHWHKGYMKEALPVLLKICFEELRVSVVYAYTHPENLASKKLLTTSGFHLEGILRAWFKNAGKSQDQCAYSLLREEWMTKIKRQVL